VNTTPPTDFASLDVAAYVLSGFFLGENVKRLCRQHAGLDRFDLAGGRGQPFLSLGFGDKNKRHGFGMDGTDKIVGVGGEETEERVGADIGRGLGSDVAVILARYAGKAEHGAVGRCKPADLFFALRGSVFVFAEGGEWDEAAMLGAQKWAPMRALDVADIGDRRAAKFWRAG